MADANNPPPADQDDAALRELFANVSKRRDPPDSKVERWEATFRSELKQRILARKQRRLYLGASAAVILLLVGVAQFMTPQAPAAPVVASVIADKNGNKLFSDRQASSVSAGLEIKVGDALLTGQKGFVALSYRGADIRLNSDTSVRFHTATLELMHGAVYVDTGIGPAVEGGSVIVSTDHGSFTHVGTQFLVQADKDQVVAAVREGAIIASNATTPDNTSIKADQGAQQIRITAAGKVETSAIERHGGLWGWVAESAPALNKADANVHDVLSWATRELGVQLRYEPQEVMDHAMRTTLPAVELNVEDVPGAVQQVAPSIAIEQSASQWLVTAADR